MFARSDPAGIWCALKFPWGLNLHPEHQQRWLPATGCPCLQVPKEFQGHWGPVDLTNCISLENTKASASWSEDHRSMCLSLDCHTHMHTHTCACKHMCVCVCTHTHTWYACVHAHTQDIQYTQACTKYAHIHTYAQYICTHNTHMPLHTYMYYVQTHKCTCLNTHIHTCTDTHARMHNIQMYTHICTIHNPCKHTYWYTYTIHMYTQTCTCACVHTCMHTHGCTIHI